MPIIKVMFFLFAALAVFAAPSLHASGFFTVNTLADQVDDNLNDGACHTSANTCSLRAAIMQANHLTEPGMTVVFVPAGTYLLTLVCPLNGEECGDLNLTAPLVAGQSIFINGAGARTTIIDANHSNRVMSVEQGRDATVVGVTIRNGSRYDNGGGILNDGTLAIIDLVIENNVAEYSGGGIFSTGVLNVRGSTLRSNVATQGSGGGIDSRGASTLQHSTLYSNRAGAFGGGVVVDFGHLYVTNSTISSNAANKNGGGIANFEVTALYNTSVIDNVAAADYHQPGGTGGGVFIYPQSRFIVNNTLIARNTLNHVLYDDCDGTLEAYGWNLFTYQAIVNCYFTGFDFAVRGYISPNLIGPLQDNGGPTLTHALRAGSEAIDSTYPSQPCVDWSGAPLTLDQRGAPYLAGTRCDVGAFEYGAVAPPLDVIFRNNFD